MALKKSKSEKFNETEELVILEDCYVLEDGKKLAAVKKVGEKVKVSGNDKVALLGYEKAARESELTEDQKAILARAKKK